MLRRIAIGLVLALLVALDEVFPRTLRLRWWAKQKKTGAVAAKPECGLSVFWGYGTAYP